MKVRLGAADRGLPTMQCHACGKLPGCRLHEHALCCAPGPSTSGHNEVRDVVLATAVVADPAAEPEVQGLLQAAPGLRPADILTSAARERILSALDVGIASPDARHAGLDAAESMRLSQACAVLPFRARAPRAGHRVLAAHVELYPATGAALTLLARRPARRQGDRKWRHRPALARRAAATVAACFGAPAG